MRHEEIEGFDEFGLGLGGVEVGSRRLLPGLLLLLLVLSGAVSGRSLGFGDRNGRNGRSGRLGRNNWRKAVWGWGTSGSNLTAGVIPRPISGPEGLLSAGTALQALLRELASFNKGLCLVTTRLPVADLAEYEGGSARHRNLEHLSSDAGAKLLAALGVKGQEAELRSASEDFSGHCLALT